MHRYRLANRLGLELLEDRRLLDVTFAGHLISVVSETEDFGALERAIQREADLTRYTEAELSSARKWVVAFDDTTGGGQIPPALGAQLVESAALRKNSGVWQFAETIPWQQIASALGTVEEVEFFYPLVAKSRGPRLVPNDPLFPNQWHLRNTGQRGGLVGADTQVEFAWNQSTGNGVVIGVVDDGVQYTHPDLNDKYRPDLSYDYWDNDPDAIPEISDPFFGFTDSHGTEVAGVAAAETNNSLGVAGVAPDAEIAGLRLVVGDMTDAQEAGALSHRPQDIDIYNNSWGPAVRFDYLDLPGPLTMQALQDGVALGRGGLGNIYTWAAGNGLEDLDNVNYDGYANSRFTIAVGAINDLDRQAYYSEPGAAMFVTAPSSGDAFSGRAEITTTDILADDGSNWTTDNDPFFGDGDPLSNLDYTSVFGGTSSATPVVSGVTALMLEANPNLTFRDVQNILAATARKNDPSDPDWTTNGAGFHVNHKYGFGAVDAAAAVRAAVNWTTVPPLTASTTGVFNVNQVIPDNDPNGLVAQIDVTDDLQGIEWVELVFDTTHTFAGDLRVVLTSPAGTQSVLAETHLDFGSDYQDWTFTTMRHWGESTLGQWTVAVTDGAPVDTGTWNTMTLNFYTTGMTPPPPSQVFAGNDSANTQAGEPVTINVLNNDNGILPGTVMIVDQPSSGTVTVDPATGQITYTPAAGVTSGADTFTYMGSDGTTASNVATVTVTFAESPVAVDDDTLFDFGAAAVIDLLANDFDPDGSINPATVTIVMPPVGGTVSVDPATGAATYTPGAAFTGVDSFTYTVDDNQGFTSNVATVTIMVSNQPPVAADDVATTAVGAPVVIPILDNDSDFEDSLDPASVQIVTNPSRGSVQVNGDGTVTYTPGAGFAGGDLFRYVVFDDQGEMSNPAQVSIRVGAPISVSGFVYVDFDNDLMRELDQSDLPIAGVTVRLEKTDGPLLLVKTVLTDVNGFYRFVETPGVDLLPAGTYRVREIHPAFMIDGGDVAGVGTSNPPGNPVVAGNDLFSNLIMAPGASASGFNFGELGLRSGFVQDFINGGLYQNGRPFLASGGPDGIADPAAQRLGRVNLNDGDVVLSFDQGWIGRQRFAAEMSAADGSVVLTLYDENTRAIAQAHSIGHLAELVAPHSGNRPRFLRVSGTHPSVTLRISQERAAFFGDGREQELTAARVLAPTAVIHGLNFPDNTDTAPAAPAGPFTPPIRIDIPLPSGPPPIAAAPPSTAALGGSGSAASRHTIHTFADSSPRSVEAVYSHSSSSRVAARRAAAPDDLFIPLERRVRPLRTVSLPQSAAALAERDGTTAADRHRIRAALPWEFDVADFDVAEFDVAEFDDRLTTDSTAQAAATDEAMDQLLAQQSGSLPE